MPGGDRTGPFGTGSMTGRAAGYCAPVPGYMNQVGGRGFWGRGRGRGGGRGWRNRLYATGLTGWQRAAMGWPPFGIVPPASAGMPAAGSNASTEQQLAALEAQAEYFEEALASTRRRIEELEAKQQKD